jgi:hypothetical protein
VRDHSAKKEDQPVKSVISLVAPVRVGCQDNLALLDMSESGDRQERLVEMASGIIAAARGQVKITQAILLASPHL